MTLSAKFLTSMWAMSIATVSLQAQGAPPVAQAEELQPRIVGATGMMTLGIAGYVDKFSSSEHALPTNYTAQVDFGWFIAQRLNIRGGLAGTGQFGGKDSEGSSTGPGAPALHGFGGIFYYFTPQSMWSLYSGGEYWAQLTNRDDPDAGSVVGKFGIQGAVSSRVSLFVDGGYGLHLTKGEDNETLSRFVGQLGLRLRL